MTKINNCLNIISGDLAESYNLSENIISNSHMVGGTRQAKTFFQEISGMNITLPSEGIYEITANIVEDQSNINFSSLGFNYPATTFVLKENTPINISNSEFERIEIESITSQQPDNLCCSSDGSKLYLNHSVKLLILNV